MANQHAIPRACGLLRLLLAGAALILGGMTFYFAIISDAPLPDHRLITGYNDLILHAGAFCALTIMTVPVLARPAPAFGCLVVFAILLEAAQLRMSTRTVSPMDLAASLAGIGLGGLILTLGSHLRADVRRLTRGRRGKSKHGFN